MMKRIAIIEQNTATVEPQGERSAENYEGNELGLVVGVGVGGRVMVGALREQVVGFS